MMEAIKQFGASVFAGSIMIYLFLFTSVGRSETDAVTVKLSDGFVLTGNTIVNFFYILLIVICMVAAIRSFNRLFDFA
jgi:hypothetical protein